MPTRLAPTLIFVGAFTAGFSAPAHAETQPADALRQLEERGRLDASIQHVRMVLVSRSGAERVREFEVHLKRDGDVLKSWTRFSRPSDVAGTQLVVIDDPRTADEQLLYLPALDRVNRIAGRARSGAFMGSDYSFADLEVSNADQATHRMVSETDTTWVIETTPGNDSAYGRVVLTIDRVALLPTGISYFDKRDQPLKELKILETMTIDGRVLPKRSEMRNLQKGTSTRMEILSQQINPDPTAIPDETFTAEWMERHR